MITTESQPKDVQPIIDAIDGQVLVEGLTFEPDNRELADLLPVEGLTRLAIRRYYAGSHIASVLRHRPRPDVGPEAFDSDVYRITQGEAGPDIRGSVETYLNEDETATLDDFLAGLELEESTGLDRVSPEVCAEVARQIGSTIPLI